MILSLAEDEAFYTTMQTHTQDVGKKKNLLPFRFHFLKHFSRGLAFIFLWNKNTLQNLIVVS